MDWLLWIETKITRTQLHFRNKSHTHTMSDHYDLWSCQCFYLSYFTHQCLQTLTRIHWYNTHTCYEIRSLYLLYFSLSRSVIFHHNQTFALFWYTFKELFYWTPFCFHFHLFIIPFVLNWKHSHDYSFTYIWQDMLCVSFLLSLSQN